MLRSVRKRESMRRGVIVSVSVSVERAWRQKNVRKESVRRESVRRMVSVSARAREREKERESEREREREV